MVQLQKENSDLLTKQAELLKYANQLKKEQLEQAEKDREAIAALHAL